MNQVAQGDLLFIKRESHNRKLNAKRVTGRITVEVGEGTHTHVIDAPAGGLVVVEGKSQMPDWIVVEEPVEVKHIDTKGKPTTDHQAVTLDEGVWEVRRQSDYQPERPPAPRNWE